SRRRHTRLQGDWSSDVCSSDLPESQEQRESCEALVRQLGLAGNLSLIHDFLDTEEILFLLSACDAIVYPYQRSEEAASGAIRLRSEERRVGKECRSRGSPYH